MKKAYLIFFAVFFALIGLIPSISLKGKGQKGGGLSGLSGEASFSVLCPDGNVKILSAKEYLFGVLCAEMSPESPDEALKAQAVAAFSFAKYKASERRKNPPADLCGADLYADSSKDQGYIPKEEAVKKWGQKADEYTKKLNRVLEQTVGVYLSFEGECALTLYHGISAGRTDSAETVFGTALPYLVPVQSASDLLEPDYCTESTVSFEEFFNRLNGLCGGTLEFSEDFYGGKDCSDSGTVKTMNLFSRDFSGKEIREAFKLRSANFDIEVDDGKTEVRFVVRGYGHLVGMSQAGAVSMAKNGDDFKEILLHYYPGCQIVG